MKKFFSIFTIAIACVMSVMFTACSSSDEPDINVEGKLVGKWKQITIDDYDNCYTVITINEDHTYYYEDFEFSEYSNEYVCVEEFEGTWEFNQYTMTIKFRFTSEDEYFETEYVGYDYAEVAPDMKSFIMKYYEREGNIEPTYDDEPFVKM